LPKTPQVCPCESGQTYAECCQPWHTAQAGPAPTPEALMRSRYSAYALGLHPYLLNTWHPSTAPGELDTYPIKWMGLEVRHAQQTADAGVVEFVAKCKVNGRAQTMHEVSRFVHEDGRWWYIDGVQAPDQAQDPT